MTKLKIVTLEGNEPGTEFDLVVPEPQFKDFNPDPAALGYLRECLLQMRAPAGFTGTGPDGTFKTASFISTSLPQVPREHLDALFDLAGIVVDAVVPRGTCRNCRHSLKGKDRGWGRPCVMCQMPWHSHFEPKAKATAKSEAA